MSWTQILAGDNLNLQKVQDILLKMHTYYALYTPRWISNQLTIRPRLDTKVYLYIEPDYELCLMVRKDDANRMQVIAIGVGKYLDLQIAADIINKKALAELNTYGLKYAYANHDSRCTPFAVQVYAMCISTGKLSGFFDAADTTVDADRKVAEVFKVEPDGTFDPVSKT